MARPYDETLSFTALMVIKLKLSLFKLTLIIATHSNINTLDLTNLYYYKSKNIPNILLPIILLFHGFRKKFIDPLNLR